MGTDEKIKRDMGWEIAAKLEQEKTMIERMIPEWRHIRAALGGVFAFFLVFLLGIWLAKNPFEATVRIQSAWVVAHGGLQGNEWTIIWSVVGLAAFFEFMDASAGMGFGTALTPLLLVMGFDPKQIVPVVMIQQGVAGLVGAFLHSEFENVEWKFNPMSETVRLWLIISVTGCAAVALSIWGVYKYLTIDKIWIQAYVAVLLLGMGAVSLYKAKKDTPYSPGKMFGFAFLAGFNKGVGGGGYGPVITIGGLIAGVPVKSMLGVTAITEGTISAFAIAVWVALLTSGVQIDYLILPSMMLATMFTAVAAPYMTRVFPEKAWKFVVPAYSLLLAAYTFYKVVPSVYAKLIAG